MALTGFLARISTGFLAVGMASAVAGLAVVPEDETYLQSKQGNVEFIYTAQNEYALQRAAQISAYLHPQYESLFGFKLDSPLYVGLISQQNQIANGFSTQFPLNMQVNYLGGTSHVDYFNSTSWLDTLIYHETAHNYQLNAKARKITRGLHSVLGNSVSFVGILPLFTVPNIMLPSFLLEGNAVLNESWHGNGGRLYSGRFLALSIMQARGEYLTPEILYNQEIFQFPYGERPYIVGGFFQLYLAEKYGLQKTDAFFLTHSRSWLFPVQTDLAFQRNFGHTFEEEVAGFNDWMAAKSAGFNEAQGEHLLSSQSFNAFNRDGDNIVFMVSDAQRAPQIARLNKNSGQLELQRGSYAQGKLIRSGEKLATQGSNFVNPQFIAQGLLDENAEVIKGTEGKMLQGYLSDGRAVYFDVASSFIQPQLYVGDAFYAQVNSSVFIDSADNLYYFKQNGKTRTLYKNQTALYSYTGYYGVVSDVGSDGAVYFVADSPKGSSLYRVLNGTSERVSNADNIVDARLLNDQQVLLAAIGSDAYYYVQNTLQPVVATPFERRYFFEDEPYFNNPEFARPADGPLPGELNETQTYDNLANLHYSGTFASFGFAKKGAGNAFAVYSFNGAFTDPLLNNSIGFFAQKDITETGIAGLSYSNSAHRLQYAASVYGVYQVGDNAEYHPYDASTGEYADWSGEVETDSRDYGFSTSLILPLIQRGHEYADVQLNYYQDYDNNARSPLILSAQMGRSEQYGISRYMNYLNAGALFVGSERGDLTYGFDYALAHDLPAGFFLAGKIKQVNSDYQRDANSDAGDYTRGVKFTNVENPLVADPTTVVMPQLEYTRFVQRAGFAEAALKKQFNGGRILFYTFPFSVIRHGAFAQQRYYEVQDYGDDIKPRHYNESTLGWDMDILVLNKFPIGLSLQYMHNDGVEDSDTYRVAASTQL